MMISINKLIILDFSVYVHKAVFSLKFNPSIPPNYTALSMILGTLYRVGVSPEDLIIFALDGHKSWRKELEKEYKGSRKEHREGTQINNQNLDITNLPWLQKNEANVIGINWNYCFQKFTELKDYLDKNTNWNFVGPIDHIEADDLISASCRYFKDSSEIIICSHDHDLEQCWSIHNGVKIFSLQTKEWKIKPDNYNVYNEIAKMLKKETSDNLVTTAMNEEELDNRQICVDLTNLPEWVEKICFEAFDKIQSKNIYPEKVPFKSLQDRFDNLYSDTSKVIDYDKFVEKKTKKEARLKIKKKELKNKLKKEKQLQEV